MKQPIVETPRNYEQKCPVVFVLDRSGSMVNDPINKVNKGMRDFNVSICNDPTAASRIEVGIVAFDNHIDILRNFNLLDPKEELPQLAVGGTTATADAVYKAMDMIEAHKVKLDAQGVTRFRPYIVLVSDGKPDADQDMNKLREAIRVGHEKKKFEFWAFGVGDDVDMELLHSLATPSSIVKKIADVEAIAKFFKWLSTSFQKISDAKEGEKVALTPKPEEDFTVTVHGG